MAKPNPRHQRRGHIKKGCADKAGMKKKGLADGMMKKIMRILMTMVFTVIIIFPHSMISSASELSEGGGRT